MDTIDLSAFFITKAQAIDFASRLGAVTEKIFQTDFNFEKSFAEQFGVQKKDKFLSLLRTHNITMESHTALKDFLQKIQEVISSLSVVSLVIAFEPSESSLMAISQWFVMNTSKQVLLDITVDPSLIAGAAINYNGRHADFSIKPAFTKLVTEMLSPPHQAATPQPTTQPAQQHEQHAAT